jgi:hypothetical protein
LYVCRRNGREVNADVNAALNIARRIGYKVKVTRRMESYIVTHSGVKPLNPTRGLTPKTRRFETPPFKAGRGHASKSNTACSRFELAFVLLLGISP